MHESRIQKIYPNVHVLDETKEFLLGHIFEDAFLIRKQNWERVFEDNFYGDPTCGCISPNNDWAVVAGEHIILWHAKNGVTIFSSQELQGVHDLRTRNQLIELLIDPWGSRASVWELDPITALITKRKDFFDYKDKEYMDLIRW
jgi:hypothetical protein